MGFSPIWEGAEVCESLSLCPCLPSSSAGAFNHLEPCGTALWRGGFASPGGRILQGRKKGQKGLCPGTAGTVQADGVTPGRSWPPCRWQVPPTSPASPAMGCWCRSYPGAGRMRSGALGSPRSGFCCRIRAEHFDPGVKTGMRKQKNKSFTGGILVPRPCDKSFCTHHFTVAQKLLWILLEVCLGIYQALRWPTAIR